MMVAGAEPARHLRKGEPQDLRRGKRGPRGGEVHHVFPGGRVSSLLPGPEDREAEDKEPKDRPRRLAVRRER